MIGELVRVFLCLAGGEVISKTGVLPFPAPVVGLIILLANLAWLGHVPTELGVLADRVLSVLGMLFVPAGVGVLAYSDLIRSEFAAIIAAVLLGTMMTLGVTGFVANRMLGQEDKDHLIKSPEAADASV